MSFGLPTRPALRGALLLPFLISSAPAKAADVYHAVAGGETLDSVARRYQVAPEALRAANNLKDVANSAPLGAMLLRVPGREDRKSSATPVMALPSVTAAHARVQAGTPLDRDQVRESFGQGTFRPAVAVAQSPATQYGTLVKSLDETVRPGDTWDSIATRYRDAGHDVSAASLQRRNNHVALPPVGQKVVVPLGQISIPYQPARTASVAPRATFTALAQTNPPVQQVSSPGRQLDGGVYASGELELPFAQDTTRAAPVYQAPNAPRVPVNRGSLPSRGGFGSMTRDQSLGGDIRILTPTEEAAAPPASQARKTSSQTKNIARVAKVSVVGARIRRLPQATAATLYQCPVGTQLAILKQDKGWSAILMSDKSTGWVPTRYLTLTAQTVDVSSQIVASSGPGGKVSSFAGTYAGENPMVARALGWLGTPYRYGGTTRRGVDCSSLVQQAFRACGYSLPRTSAQQATVGTVVDPAQLKSGDRLYFSASGSRVDHTGIYMGQGLFVHASGSGRQVIVSNLFEPRNWNIFVGARR